MKLPDYDFGKRLGELNELVDSYWVAVQKEDTSESSSSSDSSSSSESSSSNSESEIDAPRPGAKRRRCEG